MRIIQDADIKRETRLKQVLLLKKICVLFQKAFNEPAKKAEIKTYEYNDGSCHMGIIVECKGEGEFDKHVFPPLYTDNPFKVINNTVNKLKRKISKSSNSEN